VTDHNKQATAVSLKKCCPDYLVFVNNALSLSSIKGAAAIYRNTKQSITFEVNAKSVTSSLEKKWLIIRDQDIRGTMWQRRLFFCFAPFMSDKKSGNALCSHHWNSVFRIKGFEKFVCNVFLQTTKTGRSAIASEVFSFPPAEDIKKSAETGKTLGRRLQRAEREFFSFGSSYIRQRRSLSRLWCHHISSTQPCFLKAYCKTEQELCLLNFASAISFNYIRSNFKNEIFV